MIQIQNNQNIIPDNYMSSVAKNSENNILGNFETKMSKIEQESKAVQTFLDLYVMPLSKNFIHY